MHELADISQALEEAGAEPTWLATVTAIEGSAYRRPGARMLFGADGRLAGTISGGCLEREVMRTGAWLAERSPIVRTYDAHRDEDGSASFRSGCNGKVTVLIQRVNTAVRLAFRSMVRELASERPTTLATLVGPESTGASLGEQIVGTDAGVTSYISSEALAAEVGASLTAADWPAAGRSFRYHYGALAHALVERFEPAPHVSVFGTGEDAVPVARFATQLGFRVCVRALHGGFAARDRFNLVAPLELGSVTESVQRLASHFKPLAVVMTHDYEQDRATLEALLASHVSYIGMLGPRRRTERMLAELTVTRTYPAERLACVYGPAGLHLGADTPESIALSIVAEMQAVVANAEGGFLRSRRLGIHEQPAMLKLIRAEGA